MESVFYRLAASSRDCSGDGCFHYQPRARLAARVAFLGAVEVRGELR